MFVGKYKHQLDAKNRFFVPAKYRDALGEKFYLVKSLDRCISLFPEDEFQKFKAKIDEQPLIAQRKLRRFFSDCWSVEIDSQGRVAMHEDCKAYARIDKAIMIIGCGSYAEVWSEEEYNLQQELEDDDELFRIMIEAGL